MFLLDARFQIVIGLVIIVLVIIFATLPAKKENFHPYEHEIIDTVPIDTYKAEAYNKTEEDMSYDSSFKPEKTSDLVMLCDQNTGHCITHE